jgi:hypothetical protein
MAKKHGIENPYIPEFDNSQHIISVLLQDVKPEKRA